MQYIKIAMISACTLLSIFSMTGCTKFHKADIKEGYSTTYSMSPTEYTIYISKETSAASNILYTRLTMASKTITNSYPADDEIENAEDAVDKMQEIIDNVTTTMPPQEYESDRQIFLDQLEQAKEYLENYKEDLTNQDTDAIESDITLLESAFLALGGESNIAYK